MQRHIRSFGGFRLKSNATNQLERGFVACGARVACGERAKHRAANRFSTAIQQHSSTPSHQQPPEEHKNYKIDSTDDRKKDQNIQSKKVQSQRAVFDWRNPTV